MYTLGIPDTQYRRCTQVLGPENANPIEYDVVDQDDGFYLFSFPEMDEYDFRDVVRLLKNNGITTLGADEQLTERKIMKLTDLLKEQQESNRMESADDIIDALEKILETWETKEYESDKSRWENYYLDIEELVEDFKENASIDRPDIDLQEQKLRKLIRNIIKE
tara:strand:- start:188 stop:679 length:492 start_codon:yes stop_codon:yes gene_type:complete